MKVYVAADNIISPLGFDTDQNFEMAIRGSTGIAEVADEDIYPQPFYGAKIDKSGHLERKEFTILENLFIESIGRVLNHIRSIDKDRTVLILSTTKGNIDLLDDDRKILFPENRQEIPTMAEAINAHFDFPHNPVIISNACISGVSAILTAQKLIKMGRFDHAVVAGGDILSEFTVSGFQSLMAIDDEPCRPYDSNRKGITLGEACATMFITNDEAVGSPMAEILGGAQTNDANHISGPSRTGEGLKLAVEKALKLSKVETRDINYINAHGTATIFNDEMESIAFERLALENTKLNSLKGYFGHTLGAAGVLESVMSIRQMNKQKLLPSLGYKNHGVSKPLNVLKNPESIDNRRGLVLKTVSGFGGCNAAVIYKTL